MAYPAAAIKREANKMRKKEAGVSLLWI